MKVNRGMKISLMTGMSQMIYFKKMDFPGMLRMEGHPKLQKATFLSPLLPTT